MKQDEILKLTNYIEENIRSSNSSGLSFVDTRNFLSRLSLKQNHVVYGRRGSGKTSLVKASIDGKKHLDVYIDIEDFKDITFPNVVIRILIEMFSEVDKKISTSYPFYKLSFKAFKVHNRIRSVKKSLEAYMYEPDQETQDINTKESYGEGLGVKFKESAISGGVQTTRSKSKEVNKTVTRNKLDFLRIELPNYKTLINTMSLLFKNQPIFLILDDFYFVNMDTQPELIDYFHRLSKDTPLYLKVATIKHRSKLYKRTASTFIGTESPHDIQEIDMDYTLNNFDELQTFMQQLLNKAIEDSKAILDFGDIFTGDGFTQLCLASGGVPRDFLSLFVLLSNKYLLHEQRIGKVEVNDIAITNFNSKFDSMNKDSGNEKMLLEEYLNKIKKYVYNEKRTNVFLISKDDLKTNAQLRQAIRELVDLRMLHLVDENTSKAPSDGQQYEAYLLDIGLYDNSRPRNFQPIEPGHRDEKSRKDDLRSSPVLSAEFINNIKIVEKTPDGPDSVSVVKPSQPKLGLSFE
jgi:AAA+ ATPase superfamily predicted ATPase